MKNAINEMKTVIQRHKLKFNDYVSYLRRIYRLYLRYLLSENKINYLPEILGFNNIIKSCHIISYDKIMNCPKPRYIVNIESDVNTIVTFYNNDPLYDEGLNYTIYKLLLQNRIEGIRISLYPHQLTNWGIYLHIPDLKGLQVTYYLKKK